MGSNTLVRQCSLFRMIYPSYIQIIVGTKWQVRRISEGRPSHRLRPISSLTKTSVPTRRMTSHPVEDDEADDGDFCSDDEDGNDDFFEEMEGNEDDDTVPFIAPTLYVCDLQD